MDDGYQYHMLVVVPRDPELIPTDEYLEDKARLLLGTQRPSMTKRIVHTGLKRTPIGPLLESDKSLRFERAKDVVIELLKVLYSSSGDLEALLPGIRLVRIGDPALRDLRCVDGRFNLNTVYAAHPAEGDFFIPVAGFHPYLLNEKRGEFTRLATALGARTIRLVQSKTDDRSLKAEAGYRDKFINASGGGRTTRQQREEFSLSAEFHAPRQAPYLPPDLRWYKREALWCAMAEARLNAWITTYRVKFSYSEDFSIDVKLAAMIKGIGLNAGGNFTAMQKVDQEYEIEFFSPDSYEDASIPIVQKASS